MVAKSTTPSISCATRRVLVRALNSLQIVCFLFAIRLPILSLSITSPCFDLRLNTLDVTKSWIHPSSSLQTSTLFTSPSLPQSPPPPKALPRALAVSHYSQPLHDIPIISLQGIPNPCGTQAVFLG